MAKTQYWLVKEEPENYAWSEFVEDGRAEWTGVRNYQARNHLRGMRRGDLVLYYHSGKAREVVGVARVVRSAYADPTATEGDWSAVDLAPRKTLPHPVGLARIKADPDLADIALVKQSRLSVMPLNQPEFDRILELGSGKHAA